MKATLYDPHAPKKSISPSINSALLRQDRENRIYLSQALEQRLLKILREEKRRQWQEDNREAIAAYNHRVETRGVFSDGLRLF